MNQFDEDCETMTDEEFARKYEPSGSAIAWVFGVVFAALLVWGIIEMAGAL